MKCTNKDPKYFSFHKRRNRKKRYIFRILICLLFLIFAAVGVTLVYKLIAHAQPSVTKYETATYQNGIYEESLLVDSLCVSTDNVSYDKFKMNDDFHAVGMFNAKTNEVVYGESIHEKLYPASTTKILTAYLALKYGNLEDMVTVSSNAVNVPLDSSRAGLRTGDQLTLEALLYGLMLPSGNDSAVAIAEHISGSEAEFAILMTEEAKKLGATNSNFTTAHGYQDENHYTTAYDLYLILNECVKNPKFLEIISVPNYSTSITQKNGTFRNVTWNQSNQYINGGKTTPNGVTVLGGKTGTTNEAGACLVLYVKDASETPYFCIVMGADSRTILYNNMSAMIATLATE